MEEFLAGRLFRYLVFPVGSALLGLFLKWVSRNDQHASFVKEDLAVGLELMLTACLMFVVLTTGRAITLVELNSQAQSVSSQPSSQRTAQALQPEAQEVSRDLANAGWTILIMFFGLWGMSTIVRKWGWDSEIEMRPVRGIAVPLLMGILYLIWVAAGASQ